MINMCDMCKRQPKIYRELLKDCYGINFDELSLIDIDNITRMLEYLRSDTDSLWHELPPLAPDPIERTI